MREEVRRPHLPLVARLTVLAHQRARHRPDRADRREVAGIRASGDHDRRKKIRHTGASARRHRDRSDQRNAGDRARSHRRDRAGKQEEHDRQQPGIPAHEDGRSTCEQVERSIGLGDCEQEGHARKSEEQAGRKAGDHRVRLHVRGVDADGPGQRHGQQADVHTRRHAEADGDDEGEERENGWTHDGKVSPTARVFQYASTFRGAHAFRSLRNYNYRVWASGAIVSNVGTWMQRIGQDWLVLTQLTNHNATAVGFVMALQFVEMPLPVTGYAADHFNRRKLLFVTQALMALLAAGLGALTLSGTVRAVAR